MNASYTFSNGLSFTVFCGMCTGCRIGANRSSVRTFMPRAARLAQPVERCVAVVVDSFMVMAPLSLTCFSARVIGHHPLWGKFLSGAARCHSFGQNLRWKDLPTEIQNLQAGESKQGYPFNWLI